VVKRILPNERSLIFKINCMAPYYDDDGNELNPKLVKKPGLCKICRKDTDIYEVVLCNLNRLDQKDEEDFQCGAFEKMINYSGTEN
jgi:hypothetical protein